MSKPSIPYGYKWLDRMGLNAKQKAMIIKRTDAMMTGCQQYVSTGCLACVAMVLCDKYGEGAKVDEIIHLASELIDSVNKKYTDIEDLIDAMVEEYGITAFKRVDGKDKNDDKETD